MLPWGHAGLAGLQLPSEAMLVSGSRLPPRALSGFVLPGAVCEVSIVTGSHLEARGPCSLCLKSKEAAFAVMSMAADAQLRGRDMEPITPTHPQSNSLGFT